VDADGEVCGFGHLRLRDTSATDHVHPLEISQSRPGAIWGGFSIYGQKSLKYATVRSIMTKATRVEVRRGKNESATSLIRRFSRRAQGLNIVRGLRASRYYIREKSKNVEHMRAMVKGERIAEYNQLVKLGKIDPAARKTKGRK
jgi:hypothetical protein